MYDSRTPRSRRDSVYTQGSVESSSVRTGGTSKSTARNTAPERTKRGEEGRGQRRQGDVSAQKYVEQSGSKRRESKRYASGGGYDQPLPSTVYGSPSSLADTGGVGDTSARLLARDFNSLSISSEGNYTISPTTAPAPALYSANSSTPQWEQGYSQPSRSKRLYQQPQQAPVPTAKQRRQRYVAATKGGSEEIDSSYYVRTKDYRVFFKIGRVFSTLWTDALGSNANKVDPTFVSEVVYREKVFSKIRRFIVVREGDRAVTCLPVTSYDGAGHRKSGIILGDHGFIYSLKKPVVAPGMCQQSLRLLLAKGAAHLQDPSLVNYAKVYTVETNVKVKNVGELDADSKSLLSHYFWKVFKGGEETQGDITPKASGAVLAGVGAGLGDYNVPGQTVSMLPSLNPDLRLTSRRLPDSTQQFSYTQNQQSMAGTSSTYSYGPDISQLPVSTLGTNSSMYSSYANTNDPVAASPYQVAYSPARAEVNNSLRVQGGSTSGLYPQPSSTKENYYRQGTETSYGVASGYYPNQPTSSLSASTGYYNNQAGYLSNNANPANPPRDVVSKSYARSSQYGSAQQQMSTNTTYNDDEDGEIVLPTLDSARADGKRKRDRNRRGSRYHG